MYILTYIYMYMYMHILQLHITYILHGMTWCYNTWNTRGDPQLMDTYRFDRCGLHFS